MSGRAQIGVDVGGTHTDVLVVAGDVAARGKALTTYDDFSAGVLAAIEVAAQGLGMELSELLGEAQLVINGTTVVTNALTELRGARVGVLVTSGFKDTFRIGGGPRLPELDDHLQVNVPDLAERDCILEIDERIDHAGEVLLAPDPAQLRAAVRTLVEDKQVESIAVCFLSSYLNPVHELLAAEAIAAVAPDIFVSLSHQIHPLQGESRRWTTAVLNSFVFKEAREYLRAVARRLEEEGLEGGLAFFQGLGGGISRERAEAQPLALLGSGPAGGAIGANALAERLGIADVVIADMGGTSFEAGLIRGNEVQLKRDADLGTLQTGVNVVDIVSIGAGGGSIAWVSERGVPKVGPMSAGSTPGPACYGRGGTRPTVTDAMVALGFIDPDNYLGGRVTLDKRLAERALTDAFGDDFGWSAYEAAGAIHDLVVTNMGMALREVSIQKGFDPRQSLFLAYGGTLPLFAAAIADSIGVGEVVIPRGSSVFCAAGLLEADFMLRYERSLTVDLTESADPSKFNAVAEELTARGREEMRSEGFRDEDITVERSGEFRFLGQVYKLAMELPEGDLTSADLPRLHDRFVSHYEATYGAGTVWKGATAQLQTVTVTVRGATSRPDPKAVGSDPGEPGEPRERRVFLPDRREEAVVSVHDGGSLRPGDAVEGPAIIDESDTTLFVPAGAEIARDPEFNFRLRTEAGR